MEEKADGGSTEGKGAKNTSPTLRLDLKDLKKKESGEQLRGTQRDLAAKYKGKRGLGSSSSEKKLG